MRSRSPRLLAGFVAALVAQVVLVAGPAHAMTAASVSGFEVDGDFAFPHVPPIVGAISDWANLGGVVGATDAFDDGNDNVFAGGSKEEAPDGWGYSSGPKPPGKADLTRFYAGGLVTPATASIFVGFERLDVSGGGDVHVDFEFNQSTAMITNSVGTSIPRRSAGDLLLVFDYGGGSAAPTIEVRRWDGTALSGTWVLATVPAGAAEASVNLVPVSRPGGAPFNGGIVDTLRFGEAGVNLTAIYGPGILGCPGFSQAYAKTRSSGESFNSALKDRMDPVPLDLSRCPDVHVAKTASSASVNEGDTFSYTLHATNDGIVPATPVFVTDDLDDSLTVVSATYDVDPATVGGTGACIVSAGNMVSCAIGTLAASDGNTSGPEPDSADVTLVVRTGRVSCGTIDNRAAIAAGNEAGAAADDNESNTVRVAVLCPELRIVKTPDAPSVSAGDGIGFTIVLTNGGTGAAIAPTMSDTLPSVAGTSWSIVSSSTGAACAITGGTLECTQARLEAGGSMSVHVVSPTTAESCGRVPNVASFTSTIGGSGQDAALTTVLCPDVRVQKSTVTPTQTAGDEISYDLTVDNLGTGSAADVVVDDALPPGFTWSVQPSVPGCVIESGSLTCRFSQLGPGASISIHLTATTTSGQCGPVLNSVRVSASNEPASVLGNNSAGPVTIVVNCASIAIEKTADAGTVSAGDSIGFTLTTRNSGAGEARGVAVRDTLPVVPGTIWAIDGGDGSCVIAAGALACDYAAIPSGGSRSVHITSPTTAASCGLISNTGTVTTSNDGSGTSTATITVACPTLRITKTADAPSVSAGDPIGFTIRVFNDGPGTARGVVINDSLPTGFAWSISPAAAGCGITASTLFCSVGSLLPASSFEVHVIATTAPQDCGPHANTATVSATNGGLVSADASVQIDCPDVSIVKTADAATVSAGEPIGFSVGVANAGPGSAFNVTLHDPLPAGPGPGIEWSIDGGSLAPVCTIVTSVASTLDCAIGTMSAGGEGTVHVRSATAPVSCGRYDNTATVGIGNGSGGTASASTTVLCASLAVGKTADAVSVSAGDSIGFTISVSNGGPGVAHGVTLADPLPAGAGIAWSIDGGTFTAGSCAITAGTLGCAVATLPSGSGFTVHIASPTDRTACGGYQNVASVHADNHAPLVASDSTTVNCSALTLSKTADNVSADAGDQIGFTLRIGNGGPGEARNVTLTDTLPATTGTAWTIDGGSLAGSCSIAGSTLSCTVGTFASGASGAVHIVSLTTGESCGPVVNHADASSSNGGSATASATVVVNCPAGITITKRGPALAHVGDTITYQLAVSSTTITPLTAVTVTDPTCSAPPTFLSGDNANEILQSGEVWLYSCTHVVTAADPDPLPNTATATGIGDGIPVTATASHTVDIVHPSILITKTVNPISGSPGDSVVYTYVVKNTGDIGLSAVVVNDDKLGLIGLIGSMPAGSSVTLTKGATLGSAAGLLVNVGTASGLDPLGVRVTDTDDARVTVVLGVKLVATGTGGPLPLAVGLLLFVGGALLLQGARKRGGPRQTPTS